MLIFSLFHLFSLKPTNTFRMKNITYIILGLIISTSIIACISAAKNSEANSEGNNASFNDYWYKGNAELSSYTLKQARYGDLHEGEVVLIYVTEDFSASKQVKLDNPNAAGTDKIPVLKLNAFKTFNTGLYPYSIMTSVFMPVDLEINKHALKITTSVQDWCGHAFTQINNRKESFHVNSKSYFEKEGDQETELKINYLEDELWNIIRLNPEKLPTGKQQVIPGTTFTKLKHVELKAYEAGITLTETANEMYNYTIEYPSLRRTISIKFEKSFPYKIQGWEEEYLSGWGASSKKLKTTATLNKRIISDYWTKNSPEDSQLRKELGLE